MSLSQEQQALSRQWQGLRDQWEATAGQWHDTRRAEWIGRYWELLPQQMPALIEAVGILGQAVESARRSSPCA